MQLLAARKRLREIQALLKLEHNADLVALDDEHYSIAGLSNDTILDTWIFASDDNIVRDVWAAG